MDVENSQTGTPIVLEVLRKRGLISLTLAKGLIGFMNRWKVDAYRAVVETHTVEESRLADVLADEYQLNRLTRLRSRPIERRVMSLVCYNDAMTWNAFPYARDDDGQVHVAISDPTRSDIMSAIKEKALGKIVFQVTEKSEIEACIQRHYPLSMQLPQTMSAISDGMEV